MAIENIQYDSDHMRLYRRALRPVNNYFLNQLQTNQKETTKRNSIKTCKRTLSKPRSHICSLRKCSNELSSQGKNVVLAFSLRRIGNK